MRRETGCDTERYHRAVWDLRQYAGRQACLKVVDHATGGWGHVNVDDINVHDESREVLAIITGAAEPGAADHEQVVKEAGRTDTRPTRSPPPG